MTATREEPGLPRALRAAYVLWCVPWLCVYFGYFGWQFVLWFCCLANVYVLLGCVTQRALWFSLAAVAALGAQLVHIADFASIALAGRPLIGVASYMFDGERPPLVRAFSFFHLWMPLLLAFALVRLGYDRRALWIQTAVAVCVLPLCFWLFDPSVDSNDPVMPRVLGVPFDRDFNINWVHGLYDRPEPGHGLPPLWTVLFGYPLVFHLPAHWLLARRTA